MSTEKTLDKESENIYELVNPPPLHLDKKASMDISPEGDGRASELGGLEKDDQEVPQLEDSELSPEKATSPSGTGHGKRQTGFGILKSKAADAADHVKQQIKSVIPVRPKLTQEQWDKMGQRNRSKLKAVRGKSMEPEEDTLEEIENVAVAAEPISSGDEKVGEVPVVTEEASVKVDDDESEQLETSIVEECQREPVSGTTKRKYIRHRRQLPQFSNSISSLLNQVEDFKIKLKRSLTPPRMQVHRGKRRRSRSADASRATSQEPESSVCDTSEKTEEEEEQKPDKNQEAAPVMAVSEIIKPAQVAVEAPIIEDVPQAIAISPPTELPKKSVPPPKPPRPTSTLSKAPMGEEVKDGRPSTYQTFPLERPKQKQTQGYVSKFMKEHPQEDEESLGSTETTSEPKQVTEHDYEIIHEAPSKPVRRRRKQPKLPPKPPSSFQYNTIAGNEWKRDFENIKMTQPAPPARPRREKQKSESVSGSDAGAIYPKVVEGSNVIYTSNESSGTSEAVENVVSFTSEAPTTFPRKKRKGPKCLQNVMGPKEPGRPPPSMFINIMQGRPLPPPPRPERSRGSLNSLEQSSIEMSVGFRHYAQQTVSLEPDLSPIPSRAVVDIAFTYPSTSSSKPESETYVENLTMESLLNPSYSEPSSSTSTQKSPPLPIPFDGKAIATENNATHLASPQSLLSPQTHEDSSECEGLARTIMRVPSASVALGRLLLRFTSRSLQAMANYVETASSDDPQIAEAQRANKKVLLCILLVLVVGLILASNQEDYTYELPSWELWMPPPDIW